MYYNEKIIKMGKGGEKMGLQKSWYFEASLVSKHNKTKASNSSIFTKKDIRKFLTSTFNCCILNLHLESPQTNHCTITIDFHNQNCCKLPTFCQLLKHQR